ncbi:hypothetical protein [Reichenbachiella versicolor]|uniref:hypothetical protein n=1 Tax=Reichenbachiella versicolor TaxID=1821036 RepID=UPI000D6E5A75|nr:hypothetical protein [Reichenbachiella versicolor]
MAIENLQVGGRNILYANFEGMKSEDELLAQAAYTVQTLKVAEGCRFFLANFKEASVNAKFMAHIKKDAKTLLTRYPIVTAIIGIDGLKQILVQGYIRFTGSKLKIFKTKEEALQYLATAPEAIEVINN